MSPEKQTQREEAMAEYLKTAKGLFGQLRQAEDDCRACDQACMGQTHGSSVTQDSNGNYIVLDVVFNNADMPACGICTSQCSSKLWRLTAAINAARAQAQGKGVYIHELDSGRLVFGNTKD